MEPRNLFIFGPFTLDAIERRLQRDGEVTPLTPKAFDVLLVLVRNAGRVVSKEAMLNAVWEDTAVEESTLVQNIATLRRALGEGLGGVAFIETVPKVGYRFVARVRQQDSPAENVPPVEPRPAWPPRWILTVGLAGVIALATGAWYWGKPASKPVAGPEIKSLVVLPFANLSPDGGLEHISDGLTEEITNVLAGVPGLRVVARTTAFQYKGKAPDIRQIGSALHADAVLEGSIRWDRGTMRVTAQLATTKDGFHLWSRTWDRKTEDIFGVQDEIAQAIAASLIPHPPSTSTVRPKRRTTNLEAYNLYLQGRFYRTKIYDGAIEKAITLLEKSIALDPKFAPAYAALADAYVDMGYAGVRPPRSVYPQGAVAVRQALALDESISFAHAVQAFISLYFDWDWDSAERHLQKAMSLDPDDPETIHYFSHYLITRKQFHEALAASKRTLELDPLNSRMLGHLTWNYLFMGNLPEAVTAGQRAEDLHPGLGTNAYLVWAYEQQGDFRNAIAIRRKRNAKLSEALERGLQTAGVAGYWQVLLRDFQERGQRGYVSNYGMAKMHARLGDTAKALESLDRAVESRDSWLTYLEVEPAFESLRREPRFAELIRKVGIPAR